MYFRLSGLKSNMYVVETILVQSNFSRVCKTCRGAIRSVQAIAGTIHKSICLSSVPQILSEILIQNRISSVIGSYGSTG